MSDFSIIVKDWCESDNRTVIENLEYLENLVNLETNKTINLESFLPDFTNVIYDNNTIINFNMLEYQLKSSCNIL